MPLPTPIAAAAARPGPATCPAVHNLFAILCLILSLAAPAAADEDAERALLRQSWAQSCGHYDETTNWTARQACNLAWFHAHEKGVWQHNLNPHGPQPAGPSS